MKVPRETPGIDRIRVPLDGSPGAEQILPQVKRLVSRHDAQVILIRAVALLSMDQDLGVTNALLAGARDYLGLAQNQLEQEGVHVTSAVHRGSPSGSSWQLRGGPALPAAGGLLAMVGNEPLRTTFGRSRAAEGVVSR